MSSLRPTLVNSKRDDPMLTGGTAYYAILGAVKGRSGLVHGALRKNGDVCAIGSYFETVGHVALPSEIVDEVAAVNDSVPHMTMRQRKLYVARWLRWKIKTLGF